MPDRTFLDWPFFEDAHRTLANELEEWADDILQPVLDREPPAEHRSYGLRLIGSQFA